MAERPGLTRVVHCYSFWELIFPPVGLRDYTEGIYPTRATPYEEAQSLQLNYLLDQVGCHRSGFRLLDIGCGNGRLLEAAEARDAEAIGITISPEQVRRCTAQGLEVHLIDYRDIPDEWYGRFDGVIANGPIEHFVQPEDVRAGRADVIYQSLFRTMAKLLHPQVNGRFVNTTLHLNRPQPDRQDLHRSPFNFPVGSDNFHFAMLHHAFGGYYPSIGQLERCANRWFRLEREVDGTVDYRLTSEEWFRRVVNGLTSPKYRFKLWPALIRSFLRLPSQTLYLFCCFLVSQSWNWQFRGPDPPTRLLRQTWEAV